MMECLIWSIGIMEYWNVGFIWIGITLIEVGGASACSGLEAEGQESLASCLSEALLKQKYCFSFLIPNIPSFQHSVNPSAHYSNWYPSWDIPAGAKPPRSYMINELQKYFLQNSGNSCLWMSSEILGPQRYSFF
jgi:hypothetical protein